MNKKNTIEVFETMKRMADKDGKIAISLSELSSELDNKSISMVYTAIQKLIFNHKIVIERKSVNGNPTVYRIIESKKQDKLDTANLTLANVKTVLSALLDEVNRVAQENEQLLEEKKALLEKISKIKETLAID